MAINTLARLKAKLGKCTLLLLLCSVINMLLVPQELFTKMSKLKVRLRLQSVWRMGSALLTVPLVIGGIVTTISILWDIKLLTLILLMSRAYTMIHRCSIATILDMVA